MATVTASTWNHGTPVTAHPRWPKSQPHAGGKRRTRSGCSPPPKNPERRASALDCRGALASLIAPGHLQQSRDSASNASLPGRTRLPSVPTSIPSTSVLPGGKTRI